MGAKTSVAESGLTLRSFAVSTTPLCEKKVINLRNEFLVNWMFCPLIVEMSEVKIKNGYFYDLTIIYLRNPSQIDYIE